MTRDIPEGIFKPKPTGSEKKSDATTRAAQQIMDAERQHREAKTERLRLARLAREEAETGQPAPAKRKASGAFPAVSAASKREKMKPARRLRSAS